MTRIQERRVRRREWSAAASGDLGRYAVRKAERTTCPVVAASAEAAGRRGQLAIDHDGVIKTQLGEVEAGFLFIGPSEPNEVVDHLGDADCRQCTAGPNEILDFAGGRFVPEERSTASASRIVNDGPSGRRPPAATPAGHDSSSVPASRTCPAAPQPVHLRPVS